jgi:hypothetical protein
MSDPDVPVLVKVRQVERPDSSLVEFGDLMESEVLQLRIYRLWQLTE